MNYYPSEETFRRRDDNAHGITRVRAEISKRLEALKGATIRWEGSHGILSINEKAVTPPLSPEMLLICIRCIEAYEKWRGQPCSR